MYSFSTPLALSILHLSHGFRDRTFVESFGCRSLVTFQLISSEFSHIDDIVEIFLRTFVESFQVDSVPIQRYRNSSSNPQSTSSSSYSGGSSGRSGSEKCFSPSKTSFNDCS